MSLKLEVCCILYTPEESDRGTVETEEVNALGHLHNKNKLEERNFWDWTLFGSPGYLELLNINTGLVYVDQKLSKYTVYMYIHIVYGLKVCVGSVSQPVFKGVCLCTYSYG